MKAQYVATLAVACALAAWSLLPGTATADVAFEKHTLGTSLTGARSVIAKDMNRDGYMDALATASSCHSVLWWENNGNGGYMKHFIDSDLTGAISAWADDLDGDDDIDVVAAAHTADEIVWYENDGNESFTRHTLATNLDGPTAVYTTDLDGDGDVDILAAVSEDNMILWWENAGNGSFTMHTISSTFTEADDVFAFDVDGDGHMDVLGAAEDAYKISWWKNNGNESFTEYVVTSSFPGATSVRAADLDGDRDIDILGAAVQCDQVAWWENDGAENFTKQLVADDFDGAQSICARDINSDGILDLLGAAYYDGEVTWWEGSGTGSFVEYTIDENFDGATFASAGDMDNDGDIDVLAAGRTIGEIALWENGSLLAESACCTGQDCQILTEGQCTALGGTWLPGITECDPNPCGMAIYTEHLVGSDLPTARCVYTADINQDGHMDVLGAASGMSGLVWFENDGHEAFTQYTVSTTFQGPISVYATDVDGDNDIDIVGAAHTADKIAWWENDGNDNFTEWTIASGLDGPADIYATDVNRDGDVDILAAISEDNDILWWENDGNENFIQHMVDGNFVEADDVFAADVDGDGEVDILGAAEDCHQIAWWKNDGQENFTKFLLSDSFYGATSVYAADVNQDGFMDVLGAAVAANQIAWWENDGNENFTEYLIDGDFDGAQSVYACDIDADGDVDVLGSGYRADAITLWLNDGNESFSQMLVSSGFDGATFAHAADVDGDGDMDILGAARYADKISWWENGNTAVQYTCCIDQDCEILTAEDCTSLGGAWLYGITTCNPNPCVPTEAACCYADGRCEIMFENDCFGGGGAWHVEWGSCEPNRCPQPEAACCLTGQCSIMTEEDCLSAGGEWIASLTSCVPDPCIVGDFSYYFPDGMTFQQGQQHAEIHLLGSNDEAIKAYGTNFFFDPAVFEVVQITLAGTRGEGADDLYTMTGADFVRAGVVYSASCDSGQVDPGDGLMLKVVVNIREDAPLGLTILNLEDNAPGLNRMTLCNGNSAVPELFDAFDVSICDEPPIGPQPNCFTDVIETGLPYTIIVQDATVYSQTLSYGDEIGVFDEYQGEMICVGVNYYEDASSFPMAITAWEADPEHNLPGFTPGHSIVFKMATEAACEVLPAHDVQIVQGGQYAMGSYTLVQSMDFRDPICSVVTEITGGRWELVGLYVEPEDPQAPDVFRSLESLEIVQNDAGGVYIPGLLDTLSPLDITNAYYLFVEGDDDLLEYLGMLPDLSATPVPIAANRWNLIPYLNGNCDPSCGDDVTVAMASIADCIDIVQDGDGNVWIPEFGINTIGTMNASRGYKVYLSCSEDQLLTYPTCSGSGDSGGAAQSAIPAAQAAGISSREEQCDVVSPTGLPITFVFNQILIGSEPAAAGDVLCILDADQGNLAVGRAVATGSYPLPATAWEGDETYSLSGAQCGNQITYQLYDASTGRVYEEPEVIYHIGDNQFCGESYTLVDLQFTDTSGIDPKHKHQVARLEFQRIWHEGPIGSTSFAFSVPQAGDVELDICDVTGRRVAQLANGYHECGHYRVQWDPARGTGQGSQGRGVYFAVLRNGNDRVTAKFIRW